MTAAALWAAVDASYEDTGLKDLTNINDRAATSIDETVGENAAQGVIDLWPIYAEEAFDASNAAHVEVGKRAVIAMLWQRGGTASSIAKVEWDDVFGDSGLVSKIRKTGARGRQAPATSGPNLSPSGRPLRGWADTESMPHGLMPRPRSLYD